MSRLKAELHQFRQNNPEIEDIIGVYTEIEQVYREIQEAMGVIPESISTEVRSSADANLQFGSGSSVSTTGWKETT